MGRETLYSICLVAVLTFNILDHYHNIVGLQWLQYLWNHENMFETGVVQAMSVNHSTRSGGIIGISFRFSLT